MASRLSRLFSPHEARAKLLRQCRLTRGATAAPADPVRALPFFFSDEKSRQLRDVGRGSASEEAYWGEGPQEAPLEPFAKRNEVKQSHRRQMPNSSGPGSSSSLFSPPSICPLSLCRGRHSLASSSSFSPRSSSPPSCSSSASLSSCSSMPRREERHVFCLPPGRASLRRGRLLSSSSVALFSSSSASRFFPASSRPPPLSSSPRSRPSSLSVSKFAFQPRRHLRERCIDRKSQIPFFPQHSASLSPSFSPPSSFEPACSSASSSSSLCVSLQSPAVLPLLLAKSAALSSSSPVCFRVLSSSLSSPPQASLLRLPCRLGEHSAPRLSLRAAESSCGRTTAGASRSARGEDGNEQTPHLGLAFAPLDARLARCTYTPGDPSDLTVPSRFSLFPPACRASFVQIRTAKLLRWSADTPVAHRLEGLLEAKDFLLACQIWEEQMTRRDYLAALTLLTTRKRLDRRSELFLRLVDRIIHHPSLILPPFIHLLLHRFAVLGHAPALWRLAATLPPLLPQMQPAQVAVSAWSLATCFVIEEAVWSEIGRLTLIHLEALSFTDVAMLAWAAARIDRRKPQEILALKSRALAILEAQAAGGATSSSLTSPASLPPPASSAPGVLAKPPSRHSVPPPNAAAAPPHDLCMLFRAMATLMPRDLPFLLRLLYAIVASACGGSLPTPLPLTAVAPPSSSEPLRLDSEDALPPGPQPGAENDKLEQQAMLESSGGAATPRQFSLNAQALTAVWTAIADINLLDHFPLSPQEPLRSLRSAPNALAFSLNAGSPSSQIAASPAASVVAPAAPAPSVPTAAAFADGLVPSFERLFGEPFTRGDSWKRTNSRLGWRAAVGVRWMLDRLCEETRLLRLDHTVNTNMIAKLAEAMMRQKFVDARIIYQLLHFTHKRGGEQLQPEQVLSLAKAFTALNITDEKAWRKLAHRAQATAIDLTAKQVQELQHYFRRAGCANQRVEGYLSHFLFLKDDVERHGPL
ncbi:hypothetical protein BESB_006690 [Besnoitia besnoiti]|uniref:Uncharacterized protein n=1 Tax=Besnoitia besnoiti TaxID=94643 RepID=A0A2A9MIG2_BESBE|nr:hypothetical protein BESB_006690 [Besnoitia besnoiti]PFH38328.1 hypothetical protein BESB_006690 [Besnoitia besnoiti]